MGWGPGDAGQAVQEARAPTGRRDGGMRASTPIRWMVSTGPRPRPPQRVARLSVPGLSLASGAERAPSRLAVLPGIGVRCRRRVMLGELAPAAHHQVAQAGWPQQPFVERTGVKLSVDRSHGRPGTCPTACAPSTRTFTPRDRASRVASSTGRRRPSRARDLAQDEEPVVRRQALMQGFQEALGPVLGAITGRDDGCRPAGDLLDPLHEDPRADVLDVAQRNPVARSPRQAARRETHGVRRVRQPGDFEQAVRGRAPPGPLRARSAPTTSPS